ncbi:MAG: HNH endonuclease [Cytophagaceae bacterium]|nr:HNH endonuclease [Cytophagaceae bacterium]MBL0300732.1 HNH endonuclease [Cytophagaceae bacterium]MBL0327674.1 HNH endonuclease [Cytophagaceae bacterium]
MVKFVKEARFKTDLKLCCDVCGFSFVEKYGEVGLGYIEAHHTYPISELTEETQTRPEDMALVCSNCHRMLHRRRPWLDMEALKGLVK